LYAFIASTTGCGEANSTRGLAPQSQVVRGA